MNSFWLALPDRNWCCLKLTSMSRRIGILKKTYKNSHFLRFFYQNLGFSEDFGCSSTSSCFRPKCVFWTAFSAFYPNRRRQSAKHFLFVLRFWISSFLIRADWLKSAKELDDFSASGRSDYLTSFRTRRARASGRCFRFDSKRKSCCWLEQSVQDVAAGFVEYKDLKMFYISKNVCGNARATRMINPCGLRDKLIVQLTPQQDSKSVGSKSPTTIPYFLDFAN
jgi:hypothetical protein